MDKVHWPPRYFAGSSCLTTASGFGILLFRQFFLTLPRELMDAARIDGCSEFVISGGIFVPLLSLLRADTLRSMIWNDFLYPGHYHEQRLEQFRSAADLPTRKCYSVLLMVAIVISTIPLIISFLLGQRYIEQGIAFSGIKG